MTVANSRYYEEENNCDCEVDCCNDDDDELDDEIWFWWRLIVNLLYSFNSSSLPSPIMIVTPFRVFHTSVCRLFLTGVWVTASLFKSLQVSKTLLSILVDLNNAVVWMVSTRPLISNSSIFFLLILGWLYRAHQLQLVSSSLSCSIVFFSSLARSMYLSIFSLSFSFYPVVSRKGKVNYSAGSLFLWTIIRCGCPAKIGWSVCIAKS